MKYECKINELIRESNKMKLVESKINALKNQIKDLKSGKLRQCHNEIFNAYVIQSRIKELNGKIRELEKEQSDLLVKENNRLKNSDNCLQIVDDEICTTSIII